MSREFSIINEHTRGPARLQKPDNQLDSETINNRRLYSLHSRNLTSQVEKFKTELNELKNDKKIAAESDSISGIGILFKIDSHVDSAFLKSAYKFEVLYEFPDSTVLVSAKDPQLDLFLSKVAGFGKKKWGTKTVSQVHKLIGGQGSQPYLEKILSPFLLENWPYLNADDSLQITISVSCDGLIHLPEFPELKEGERATSERYQKKVVEWEQKYDETYAQWEVIKDEREAMLINLVEANNGTIMSLSHEYIENNRRLPTCLDAMIEVTVQGLKDILFNMKYIIEVKERIVCDVPISTTIGIETPLQFELLAPSPDAPTICVIDSGIQERHPLLQNAVNPALSESHVEPLNDVSDWVPGGHGTRVAGAILYPDGIPTTGQHQLKCNLMNFKVLDEQNSLPEYVSHEEYFKYSLNKARDTNCFVKIINHSINSFESIDDRGMSSFGQSLDYISHKHDVVIVQSAGNVRRDEIISSIASGKNYPGYLFDTSSRIASPGESLCALTVGSVAHDYYSTPNHTSIANGKNHVSSFSRCGFGLWNSIKPDVVDYGGDYVKDTGTPPSLSINSNVSPELVRSAPGALYAKDNIGTSFAAPRVSSALSDIQNVIPGEPALLYKTLTINAAAWPDLNSEDDTIASTNLLRTHGYGIVNRENCVGDSPYRITSFTDGHREISPRQVHIFKLSIPETIRTATPEIDVRIDITMCFTAIPKRTKKRLRRYFSTWVNWKVSRTNENEKSFLERVMNISEQELFDESEDPNWMLGEKSETGKINGVKRSNGANQKDWAIFKSNQLPPELFVAVIGHTGWSTDPNSIAQYSLAMSMEIPGKEVAIN